VVGVGLSGRTRSVPSGGLHWHASIHPTVAVVPVKAGESPPEETHCNREWPLSFRRASGGRPAPVYDPGLTVSQAPFLSVLPGVRPGALYGRCFWAIMVRRHDHDPVCQFEEAPEGATERLSRTQMSDAEMEADFD
jgi:hypothetical protein